ncbi:hypothetical protein ACQ4M4_19535 [Leptolyngbya sp. AN02str]
MVGDTPSDIAVVGWRSQQVLVSLQLVVGNVHTNVPKSFADNI